MEPKCATGDYVMRTVLKEKRDYYDEHLDQLRSQYPDQHLVIRGQQVSGAYSGCDEAIRAVYANRSRWRRCRQPGGPAGPRSSLRRCNVHDQMSVLRIVAAGLIALIAAAAAAHSPPRPITSRSPATATATGSGQAAACNGTCVVDVAFSYEPEALAVPHLEVEGRVLVEYPRSQRELASVLRETFPILNGIFQASGVDVVFRMTGLEPAGSGRPAAGADLWYVIDPDGPVGRSGGWASLPIRNPTTGNPLWQHIVGVDGGLGIVPPVRLSAGTSSAARETAGVVLAHEFGHSLGLHHGPHFDGVSEWPGGNGYFGSPFGSPGARECIGTMMAGSFINLEGHGCSIGWNRVYRFSARGETYYRRPIGNVHANATAVIKRNLPYLVARSPAGSSVRDWGCYPGDCIDSDGRFLVSVRYREPNSPFLKTAEMSAFRVSDSAALFYFFSPDNPEMLLKVLNGCGVNGHWWVFGSAATDLSYDISVSDLAGGRDANDNLNRNVKYEHEEGVIVGNNGFSGVGVINDVQAFRCP